MKMATHTDIKEAQLDPYVWFPKVYMCVDDMQETKCTFGV